MIEENRPPYQALEVEQQGLLQLQLGALILLIGDCPSGQLMLQFSQPFPGNHHILLVPVRYGGCLVAQQGRCDECECQQDQGCGNNPENYHRLVSSSPSRALARFKSLSLIPSAGC